MKALIWGLLSVTMLLAGYFEQKETCTPSSPRTVQSVVFPDTVVDKSALHFDHQTSMWKLDQWPYSGFVVTYYPDGSPMEKFRTLRGKRQNTMTQWYPDGHLKSVATYHKGKLHGPKKIWSSDSVHVLIAQYNYQLGKPHGEQLKWYSDGQLFKKMNFNRGKEEGLQQAYRPNGVLYANYEVRNGRVYGLNKSKLCYQIQDGALKSKKLEK
ncbi:MAG: membrane-binding protein [Bacteroidota bacterium]